MAFLRRWLPIALLLSLGGNMFLAGFLVGRPGPPFDHGGPPGPPRGGPPGPAGFFQRMADGLPPADGDLLRAAVAANRDLVDASHRMHQEMPDKLRTALLAEPFDPAALASVFESMNQQEHRLHEQLDKALVQAAAAMSPEGRRRMAEFRP